MQIRNWFEIEMPNRKFAKAMIFSAKIEKTKLLFAVSLAHEKVHTNYICVKI